MYSDHSLDELVEWGRARGLKPEWIDRKHALPHFDVRADSVAEHEPGVERRELVEDIRRWRRSGRGGSVA